MRTYDYDPDPEFCLPEDYSMEVWKREPELRTYAMPRYMAWNVGTFLGAYSDFDVLSAETDWHRWGPDMAHRDYSRSKNLHRQLIHGGPDDATSADPTEPRYLRLSWQQAMDVEFVLLVMMRTIRGQEKGKRLDETPIRFIESRLWPTIPRLKVERDFLRADCIRQYRLAYWNETNPPAKHGGIAEDADPETVSAAEKFKQAFEKNK